MIREHFPAFAHCEINTLPASLGTVMNWLKKCFGTLGSENSHLVGQSIHHTPSEDNTWYLGKMVNSFSLTPLRWSEDGVPLILLMWSHTPMHSALVRLLGHPLFTGTDIQCTLKWLKLIGPPPWLSGNGSSVLGELLGCCEGGRALISPPHKCTLGRAGIHKARWDKGLA